MINARAYLLPDLARSLPCGSPERALASLALRNLWHSLFDTSPTVLAMSPPDGKSLLEPFLEWADKERISMGWSLHVHLLGWLCKAAPWRDKVNADQIKELLVAAAARWALNNMEHTAAKGILIGSVHFPGFAVGAWRSTKPSDRFRAVLLKIPDKTLPSDKGYVLSYEQGLWGELTWNDIPK